MAPEDFEYSTQMFMVYFSHFFMLKKKSSSDDVKRLTFILCSV